MTSEKNTRTRAGRRRAVGSGRAENGTGMMYDPGIPARSAGIYTRRCSAEKNERNWSARTRAYRECGRIDLLRTRIFGQWNGVTSLRGEVIRSLRRNRRRRSTIVLNSGGMIECFGNPPIAPRVCCVRKWSGRKAEEIG